MIVHNTPLGKIDSTIFASSSGWNHHWTAGVLCISLWCRNLVIYRNDWLSIKFCENDSFRKLFLFLKKIFQYLSGISQDISVSRFDSRRSLSSANGRRSTLPMLFVSFIQPCDHHDRKIRMIRKSAAWWRGLGVVREAIGNYFCVRICYMFPVSKCRGDWDLVLCTTSVLAFGDQMRDGKIRKKTCFDKGKIGFCHCASVLQAQVPKLCTDLDLSLLYTLTLGTHSKFAWKNNFLALSVCCPDTTKRVPHKRNLNWNGARKSNPSRLVDD